MKIVLGGPPQSGKSCLRAGLKEAIRGIAGAPYPYFITGCPDGEGAWFTETAAKFPELARELKDAYKASFTPEFARQKSRHVANCQQPLTFVDIGGKISPENRVICAPATHIVLLAGNCPKTGTPWEERLAEWRSFAEELGLVVAAEIFSDYHGESDSVQGVGEDGVFRTSIHFLDRTVPPVETAKRPGVVALADFLVSLL